MEEEVGSLNIHRQATDFVNNEHFVLAQGPALVGQAVLKMRLFELLNEGMTVDVVGRAAVSGSNHAEGRGEMRLAHPRRAEEHDIPTVF